MGAALYFPALAALDLLDAARRLFRLPRSERFGVRAVFLTLFFLTLLHKPTVESAKHLVRRSFGALVGTGRAPCVKTLRRKLAELAVQSKAAELGRLLARRWVDAGLVATAYLYVDGHVKAYAGKQKVQEVWNSQRRMPLPGVLTYFVGDGSGRPLLFVTDEVHPSLAKSMRRIVQAIREVLGERGFTVVFDRGGYDGRLFAWLHEQGIGFITYQRDSPNLSADRFSHHETRFEGKRVRFKIAEDQVNVGRSGPWRRIVVRTKTGHQMPILTGLPEEQGGPARIASLMFARWRQENFFRYMYMAEHHGLGQLCSYATEPAPDQLVPNPQRKRLQREPGAKRKQAAELRAQLGDALVSEPKTGRSAHGLKIAKGGTVKTLRTLEQEIAQLEARHKACPTHAPLSASGQARKVFRLEQKTIVDRIKVCAYNAEKWLLDHLGRHYPNTHDIRDLLRSFADLSGEMRSTPEGVVTLAPPRHTPTPRRPARTVPRTQHHRRHLSRHPDPRHLPGGRAPFTGRFLTPHVQTSDLTYEVGRLRVAAGARTTVASVLLHEVVTDMALALNMDWLFRAFVRSLHAVGVVPGFDTRNLPTLVQRLRTWGIEMDGLVFAAPFNAVGFQMSPSREACEQVLASLPGATVIAFSVLAGGYLSLPKAVEDAAGRARLDGVVIGVSGIEQARSTFALFRDALRRSASPPAGSRAVGTGLVPANRGPVERRSS